MDTTSAPTPPDNLMTVLDRAWDRGYLGPGPVEQHLEHARTLIDLVAGLPPGTLVDLGSGGGVPALPVLVSLPAWRGVLVERSSTRARHLRWAVRLLGLGGRVDVVEDDAVYPRRPDASAHLHGASVVSARAFGPPLLTAEAATRWLAPHGVAIVSGEPVLNRDRWPAAELAPLGLMCERLVRHRRVNWILLRAL